MSEKTPEQKRTELLGHTVVKNLNKRNFEAYYCQTAEEAKAKALELIPEGSSVSWGGSMTIRNIGLTTALIDGNYDAHDRDREPTREGQLEVVRQGLLYDYFLTSSNAIGADGVLVNIDGTGNRVAALCFGPQNVIVIAGINKVVADEQAAMVRARTVAAPINMQRFADKKTPCSTTGMCGNCLSDDCICCQILTTRFCKPDKRIKVIIVGEELGY